MLLIHFTATVFMTGVIWLVQVVIYPQLRLVPDTDFVQYEKAHMRRIGFVVGPMMLVELFSALWLLVFGHFDDALLPLFYLSIALGILIGVSTVMLQAPLHIEMAAEGKIDSKINKLITSNWIRTIAWTGRSVLVGYIIYASCYG